MRCGAGSRPSRSCRRSPPPATTPLASPAPARGRGRSPVPLPPARLLFASVTRSRVPAGLAVELRTDPGTLTGVELTLWRGRRRLVARKANHLQALRERRVLLPYRGVLRGRLTLRTTLGRRTLAERTIRLR